MNSEGNDKKLRDEMLLIDFLLGNCTSQEASEIVCRLDGEPEFRRLHDDLEHTFAALGKLPEPAAPDDLTARTMATINASRRRSARLARDSRGRAAASMFSLREVAAVAAAVVLMAVVVVSSMGRAEQSKLRRHCASNTAHIGMALSEYHLGNDGRLPDIDAAECRWMTNADGSAVSTSSGLFKLVRQRYVPVGVFVCPAEGNPGRFDVHAGMVDFPSADHINFSYQNTLGGKKLSVRNPRLAGAVADQMAILADQSPVFAGMRFNRDRIATSSDNHAARPGGKGPGQNVLYLSGHVQWRRTPEAGVDNNDIFLINDVDNYEGDEVPTDDTDTFLLPAYSTPPGK
ncbi:MAG: hypothetical protein ACYS8X_06035 [Planctomycetota bacterium]|jgi:hypothetical protein